MDAGDRETMYRWASYKRNSKNIELLARVWIDVGQILAIALREKK
jgi:hypothetical protein